jgi:glycosyltransferase involved in cell wall biosynthesis
MDRLPITVVIPLYNRRETICETVDSVSGQQAASAAAIIVVDDASTDGSAGAASRCPDCEVVRLESNGGAAAARNAGLARVATPWVCFLDSDDLWLPSLLRSLWPHTTGNVLVSGAAVLEVDERPVTLLGAADGAGQELRSPVDVLVNANPIVTSATLVRTEVVRGAGGFDAGLRYSEDLDLWLRVLEHGRGWCDPTPVLTYRRDATSKSQEAHGGVEQARAQIARRYERSDWWSPGACERYLGGMYWEGARSAIRAAHWPLAWRHLGHVLRHPQRIRGAVEGVDRNRRRRRQAGALGAGHQREREQLERRRSPEAP